MQYHPINRWHCLLTYEEFEATRNRLISTISQNLQETDKEFILSLESWRTLLREFRKVRGGFF